MTPRVLLLNGLRDQNPGFVQLLGLCPLLAVSTSVANALGLGIATLAVLLTSNALAALAGPRLPREVRLAAFVMVIAAAVTAGRVMVTAADSAGKAVGVDAMIQGEVTGVNYRDGVTYLSVGNREIAFSDVVSVKKTSTN